MKMLLNLLKQGWIDIGDCNISSLKYCTIVNVCTYEYLKASICILYVVRINTVGC